MDDRGSRRSRELRLALAEKFGLPPETVGAGLVAVIGAIHDRLPRGARVALVSWLPECWSLLGDDDVPTPPTRGVVALAARVSDAGIPSGRAVEFVAVCIRLLGERCGTPLADALRRRVPELAEVEQRIALKAVAGLGRPT